MARRSARRDPRPIREILGAFISEPWVTEEMRPGVVEASCLTVIEIATADEGGPRPVEVAVWPDHFVEWRNAEPEQGGRRHAMRISTWRSLRRVEIAVRVEPDQTGHWSPGRSECPSDARHGSDRERVVAAHDERKMPFRDNRLDSFAQ